MRSKSAGTTGVAASTGLILRGKAEPANDILAS
jgi:hypothetical protein